MRFHLKTGGWFKIGGRLILETASREVDL